jgi:hypothetical protein
MVHILTNRRSGLLCRSRCWTWRLLSSFSSIGRIPANESFREYWHWSLSCSYRFIRLSSSSHPGESSFGGKDRTTFWQFWCEEHLFWNSIAYKRDLLYVRSSWEKAIIWHDTRMSSGEFWSIWELFSVPMEINKFSRFIRSHKWCVSMHCVQGLM